MVKRALCLSHSSVSPRAIARCLLSCAHSCNCAVSQSCPFVLNLERYHNNQGYDQWPGGFFMEVLVHADSSHPFWQTDLLVVLDFSPVRARATPSSFNFQS